MAGCSLLGSAHTVEGSITSTACPEAGVLSFGPCLPQAPALFKDITGFVAVSFAWAGLGLVTATEASQVDMMAAAHIAVATGKEKQFPAKSLRSACDKRPKPYRSCSSGDKPCKDKTSVEERNPCRGAYQ